MTLGAPAKAQNFDDVMQAKLLTGWRAADGSHMAAIQLDLAPGWHTYWRAPGEAGIPTLIDARASKNLRHSAVIWPRPSVFTQNGYRSYGYEGRVVLPIRITPRQKGKDITFTAQIDLGVCKDICVPQTLNVSAVLPSKASKRDPRIAAALADVPYSAREAGAKNVTCALEPSKHGMALTVRFTLPPLGKTEAVVIETGDELHWVSAPKMKREGHSVAAVAEVQHVEEAPILIKRDKVTISVIGRNEAVEMKGCARG